MPIRPAPGQPVRMVAPRTLPMYGRVLRGDCPPGLLRVRLTADHARGRKGACLYVRIRSVRLTPVRRHARGLHRRPVVRRLHWLKA